MNGKNSATDICEEPITSWKTVFHLTLLLFALTGCALHAQSFSTQLWALYSVPIDWHPQGKLKDQWNPEIKPEPIRLFLQMPFLEAEVSPGQRWVQELPNLHDDPAKQLPQVNLWISYHHPVLACTKFLARLLSYFYFLRRGRIPGGHAFCVAGWGPSMAFQTLRLNNSRQWPSSNPP